MRRLLVIDYALSPWVWQCLHLARGTRHSVCFSSLRGEDGRGAQYCNSELVRDRTSHRILGLAVHYICNKYSYGCVASSCAACGMVYASDACHVRTDRHWSMISLLSRGVQTLTLLAMRPSKVASILASPRTQSIYAI